MPLLVSNHIYILHYSGHLLDVTLISYNHILQFNYLKIQFIIRSTEIAIEEAEVANILMTVWVHFVHFMQQKVAKNELSGEKILIYVNWFTLTI